MVYLATQVRQPELCGICLLAKPTLEPILFFLTYSKAFFLFGAKNTIIQLLLSKYKYFTKTDNNLK